MTLDDFQAALTVALADELIEWHPRLEAERMRVFDLGCYPWFESIELSFLTTREDAAVTVDPGKEIAAWRLYGFSARAAGVWSRGKALLAWLEARRRADDRRYSNEDLWRTCAASVQSDAVQRALALYRREPEFLCTVFDPDDARLFNYCSGSADHWLVK